MLRAIADAFNRLTGNPRSVRRYEAVSPGGGRRLAGLPHFGNAANSSLVANPTLRGRQRTLVANSPYAANIRAVHVSATVGCGIKPQSTHPDKAIRAKQRAIFNRWVDNADIEGRSDFYGLQVRVWGDVVVDGEAFVRLTGAGRDLRLQHIPTESIDANYVATTPSGGRIVGGVEFDASGARVAFHVFRTPPGAPFAQGYSFERIRIPATDMLHVYDQIWCGQVRGISVFASIILRINELEQIEDAQLIRVKLGAMLMGLIRDTDGAGAHPFANQGERQGLTGVADGSMEPGTFKLLPAGHDINFTEPVEPGDVTAWFKQQLHAVAAGAGITYEQLTGDLSAVNYSSIRAGLVEFRRRVEMAQHQVLVFQFCRPVWRRLMLLAMLRGDLPDGDLEEYCAVNWIPPGFDWVDPLKDAKADSEAIASGLKSRREVVAARGYDVEQLDAEIAADRAREKSLGLDFRPAPTAPKEMTTDA